MSPAGAREAAPGEAGESLETKKRGRLEEEWRGITLDFRDRIR
jgi:hypothetical protein